MTIAVAKGILKDPSDPIQNIGNEFLRWNDTDSKDIGNIIHTVFQEYMGDWFTAVERAHKILGKSAGNGSLMRCLPVALAYPNKEKMEEVTQLQSRMTHYDNLATEACMV
jgi:ADP-ribosyl-[dinitrogen reductase] hydrolase